MRRLVYLALPAVAAAMFLSAGTERAVAAGTTVTTAPRQGPPTTNLTVNGSGFTPSEAADVYFDATDMVVAATSSSGTLHVHFRVPAAAAVGTHYVTAVGRSSGLSAQTTFLVATSWTEFHANNGRTGFSPYENTLSVSNVSDLVQAWSFATGGHVESSPAVVGGLVFFGSDDGSIYAVNATTGALKWSVATGGAVKSSPAVSGGIVYIGSEDGKVYALQASTGSTVWVDDLSGLEAKGFDSSPLVSGGKVFIGGASSYVYALDAATGFADWATAGSATCGGWSTPSLSGSAVFAQNECDGSTHAFGASTGTELWTGFAGYSPPTTVNGRIFSGALGQLWDISASTGNTLWIDTFDADQNFGAAALAAGQLYLADTEGKVYQLVPSTGASGWTFSVTESAPYYDYASSPAVANGVVYAGSADGNIRALSAADGRELWSALTGGPVLSSPAVANGVVYAGSDDGSVYAYALPGPTSGALRPAPAHLRPDLHLLLQR